VACFHLLAATGVVGRRAVLRRTDRAKIHRPGRTAAQPGGTAGLSTAHPFIQAVVEHRWFGARSIVCDPPHHHPVTR